MKVVVAASNIIDYTTSNFKLREDSFQALLSRLAAIRLRDKKVENLWYCPELSRDKRSLAISSSYPEHGGINGCHLWEISRSPLISPCLRAALLRYQTTKEQLHEKLLSAITTFTFLLIFLLSSILAVDWADTGGWGCSTTSRGWQWVDTVKCRVWRMNVWSVSSVSVSASGWSLCRMVTVCFLCRGRCGTVAPAEALVPASPSHNHRCTLYCTVLYCTVYTHCISLCTIIATINGWHKENSMGYVKNVLPTEASTVQLASERWRCWRPWWYWYWGDDVSPLHYIEDIELQYTEVPHLRCSDKDW